LKHIFQFLNVYKLERQGADIQTKIEELEYLNQSSEESFGKITKSICCAFILSLKRIPILMLIQINIIRKHNNIEISKE
jgi:hypothetical protein